MTTAFFNVETSLTGRRWIGPSADQDRLAQALAQTTGHPIQLCQVLARLAVSEAEVETYLSPSLRDTMPNPMSLRDMETASKRLATAAARKERIAVFADYDVDGAASGALLID